MEKNYGKNVLHFMDMNAEDLPLDFRQLYMP